MGRSSLLVDVPKAKAKERSQRKAKEKPKKSQRGDNKGWGTQSAQVRKAQVRRKPQRRKAVNPLASFWNWTERRNHKGKAGPVRMGLSD